MKHATLAFMLFLMAALCAAAQTPVPSGLFGAISYLPQHVYSASTNFNGGVGANVSFSERIGSSATYAITGVDIVPKGGLKNLSLTTVPSAGIEQVIYESKSGKSILTLHGAPGATLPTGPTDTFNFAMSTGFKYFRKINANNAVFFKTSYIFTAGTGSASSLQFGVGFAHAAN